MEEEGEIGLLILSGELDLSVVTSNVGRCGFLAEGGS